MNTLSYTIHGDDMQAVDIQLQHNEAVRAEAGAMMYMDQGVEMDTKMEGGIFGGVKRVFSGESFFIPTFLNKEKHAQHVAFAAPYPGKIIPINLADYHNVFICQRDSFLCAQQGIEVAITFSKKIGAGLFGGEGFILQKLTGTGMAFLHAGGTIIERKLKQDEVLKVDTGCLVGFANTVDYDIRFIGGIKNTLFGGEGLFYATVKGPGTVYLQSLPLARLADRIVTGSGTSGGEGGLGNMLGGLVSGD